MWERWIILYYLMNKNDFYWIFKDTINEEMRKMIFIGYSNQDRYAIVEPIVFHLKNYSINVWYDFHDMFLSDNRYHENFELGIGKSKYVIFIISHDFFNSNCAVEELNYAQTLYEKGEIVLFPILYLIKASELPNEYSWIRKIIYNEVTAESGTLFVTNQIIEKMLHDESKTLPLRSFSEISNYSNVESDKYLKMLLETYLSLDIPNYSAKMALLYAAYLYVSLNDDEKGNTYIEKIINRIVTFSSLNIPMDHLTFNIFQLTVLIAFNKYLL